MLISGTDFLGTPFSGPPAAMLLVHGRRDTSVQYDAARTVFEAVPWSRAMLTIADGGHQISGRPDVISTSAAFLRWSCYGGDPGLGDAATFDNELTTAAAPAR
ncbi:hypothetical protein M1L60_35660 [Actinoplanes sp. TRM 88003]|uniref:Peptidase S9 prolyl oligopeptidase catalytic domain-containing protein n=1 Tax=Paractinoplanes aksuensis TaxID=2939490 RepID=A0ABT1DYI5_9ACTN|nr:hypothetical protein [Actinoplanes aksuensis]MCO8275929.1 hypothetical protein [Actinoplanes aksuensis]